MADNTVSTNPVMMTDKLASPPPSVNSCVMTPITEQLRYDTYYETGETQLRQVVKIPCQPVTPLMVALTCIIRLALPRTEIAHQ